MTHRPLQGQKALVTGASSGIGEGVARALGAAGADVVVNYVAQPESAERIADEIAAGGVRAVALRADVSSEADVETMFEEVAARLGGIDILVNNAHRVPLGQRHLGERRIGVPEDIGKVVAFLVSDDADYIHGQTIFVDGGMTLYPEFADGG
jgi:NAD(P)-dependent dehydrogenase (short-subunit alcohol dehydrogenase family)